MTNSRVEPWRHASPAKPVHPNVLAVLLVASVSLALLSAPALAASKVVSIGDSWGALLPPFLDTQFDLHGHGDYDVLNIAVPGATASAYAGNMGGVLDLTLATIAATPDLDYVYISLGGNDLAGGYPALGAGVFDQIEADLRTIIDRILAIRPDIEILFSSYDVLKFDKSEFCLLFAYTQFGKVLPWEVTPLFLEIGARESEIDADYPAVTTLNLWGTGQGSPGNPNLLAWSPSAYVANPDEDCLHLSDSGHTQFAGEIYDAYFAARLAPKCGTVATAGGGPPASSRSFVWMLLPAVAAAVLRARGRPRRGRP